MQPYTTAGNSFANKILGYKVGRQWWGACERETLIYLPACCGRGNSFRRAVGKDEELNRHACMMVLCGERGYLVVVDAKGSVMNFVVFPNPGPKFIVI